MTERVKQAHHARKAGRKRTLLLVLGILVVVITILVVITGQSVKALLDLAVSAVSLVFVNGLSRLLEELPDRFASKVLDSALAGDDKKDSKPAAPSASAHDDGPTISGEAKKVVISLLRRLNEFINSEHYAASTSAAAHPQVAHAGRPDPGSPAPQKEHWTTALLRNLMLAGAGFLLPWFSAVVSAIGLYLLMGDKGLPTATIIAQPVTIVLGGLVMIPAGAYAASRGRFDFWIPVVIGVVISQIVIQSLRTQVDYFTPIQQVGLDIARVALPWLGAKLGAWQHLRARRGARAASVSAPEQDSRSTNPG